MRIILVSVMALVLMGSVSALADDDTLPDLNIVGSGLSIHTSVALGSVAVSALPEATPNDAATETGFAPNKPSNADLDQPTNDF